MSITQKKFDALVKELEICSKKHPNLYRVQVALLAVLGYAYIFIVLSGLLLLIGLAFLFIFYSGLMNSLIISVIIGLLALVLMLVRSLWVITPAPQGLKLNSRQTPRLFALVKKLTVRLGTPQFHKILLNHELNAAVVQVPRLGVFGQPKNYLLLGLPLMQSLSPEKFKAVLAHEMGHLSRNHSGFTAWIYRLRKTWILIYQQLHRNKQQNISVLFDCFLNWYWPLFNAYSFILARMNEYEADRYAAKLAGAKNIAEALIHIEIKARFLETSYWPDIYKQVKDQATPPQDVFSAMRTALCQPVDDYDREKWFKQALSQKTNNIDTHPCLAERLQSLGYITSGFNQKISQLTTVQTSAADYFLGKYSDQFAQSLDLDWKKTASTSWKQHYTLGRILLEQSDQSGIAYIEKAIAKEIDWVIDGCELIYHFLTKQGQAKEAQKYRQRAEQHYQLLLYAQNERAGVNEQDEFKPHTLKVSEINQLKGQLRCYPEIQEAYLVEKVVKYFPEKRFLVLGIIRNRRWIEDDHADDDLIEQLVNRLKFPTAAYIIILNHSSFNFFQQKICPTERSLIWQRD